jgi:choline/glycine/proline betaine transport protein
MPKNSGSICKPVFFSASLIIGCLVIFGIFDSESVGEVFQQLQNSIVVNFSWFYVISMTGFLIFAVYLLFSKYGHIRLSSNQKEKPEFPYLSWLAMLFSAGMGIGLLFYAVAEPLYHFQTPLTADPNSQLAAQEAMALSFLHWGLHPWACYALIGLIVAYFGFRKKLPFSLRSAFHPLIGDRIYGFWGHLVDTLAVVSTLFGVATSLGLGAMQINAGLAYRYGLDIGTGTQVLIIGCITLAATVSVVTGLKAGVRRLSEINIFLALCLLVFVFLAGSSIDLLNSLVQNIGAYFQLLPQNSFWTAAYITDGRAWLGSWTVFYWAWWIAWSPFVGIFIARISKGRTIREFMAGVLLVPCFVTFIWLTVFGNSALDLVMNQGSDLINTVNNDLPSSLFHFLEAFPATSLFGGIATICIALFFVTSSDSASLVIDTIASGGKQNPDVRLKVYWAILEGAVAAVLLYVGGLKALQTASITSALPFCFVILLMAVSLMKSLSKEKLH